MILVSFHFALWLSAPSFWEGWFGLDPAVTLLFVKILPPLALIGAAVVAGRRSQRERLRVLDQDPAALSRLGLAEARGQLRRIVHFLDIKSFNSFILITLIIILAIFFINHPPGYLALLLVAGLLGWNFGRGLAAPARKVMARVLIWLGRNYLREEKWEDLEVILGRLTEYPANIEKVELAWMQANLAVHQGRTDDAIAILGKLPASPRLEPLLIQLLVESGDRKAVDQRLARLGPERALAILINIPASPARDRALLERWADAGDWEAVGSLLSGRGAAGMAASLEDLPASPERDDILIAALAADADLDKIVRIVMPYGAEEGEAKLGRLLAPGQLRDEAMIALLGGCGRFDRVREYLGAAPLGRVVPLLTALPGSEARDRLVMELLVSAGDREAVLEHFDPREPSGPIRWLRSLAPGLARDRLLGYYSSYAGDLAAVVDCLEKYLAGGLLNEDEGRVLAQAYAKLGFYEKVEDALRLSGNKGQY